MFSGRIHPDILHISVIRSLYFSIRFSGQIVILRRTRIRLDRGAKIHVSRGSRLVIGRQHPGGSPSSLVMQRNARLKVHGGGMVSIARGVRILVLDHGQLEIGGRSVINFSTTITCHQQISIGPRAGISWNTNIFDGNFHQLSVDGVERPPSKPVLIGEHVWIGSGATVMGVAIGDGALVGAGSVVVSDVPSKTVVAGNPARIIGKNVSFQF